MASAVVVVVGSLHYDIMLEAPHLPARGETVAGRRWYPKFGGKGGNQALAAHAAGAEVRMLGAVGDDAFGRFLLDRLAAAGLATTRIARLAEASGMSVAIAEAAGDYGAVTVSGANLSLDPACLDEPALWQGARVLLLQNEIPEPVNLAAARAARSAGARVILNAAPMREMAPELLALTDLLVVNAVEAEAMAGLPAGTLAEAEAAARALAARVASVIVTAGGEGAAWAGAGRSLAHRAMPVEVVSAHGAGDCYAGTLAAALAGGADLPAAMDEASRAAAIQVGGDVAALED